MSRLLKKTKMKARTYTNDPVVIEVLMDTRLISGVGIAGIHGRSWRETVGERNWELTYQENNDLCAVTLLSQVFCKSSQYLSSSLSCQNHIEKFALSIYNQKIFV
jgi:hypothetical protein